VRQCSLAIDLDENATKALFIRSVAQKNCHNFSEAQDDLKRAIKLAPADKNLRNEWEALKAEKKKYSDNQANAMKAMFSQGLYEDKKSVQKRSVFDQLPAFDPENI